MVYNLLRFLIPIIHFAPIPALCVYLAMETSNFLIVSGLESFTVLAWSPFTAPLVPYLWLAKRHAVKTLKRLREQHEKPYKWNPNAVNEYLELLKD